MKNDDFLPGKKVRRVLEKHLTAQGWHLEANGIPNHNIDIEARRGREKWIIEVKGTESPAPVIFSSFVSALGGILRRMDDQNCKYSIALPDTKPFRRLWERLPAIAKDRTGITALFVDQNGGVEETTG
ncbi:MAG: hypothetical protein WC370_10010 [Dehalococcoidales bacterium]|jgi:hypothetical protein